MLRISKTKLILFLLILFFFVGNCLWVLLDKQVPIIADDERFLQATYELSETIKTGFRNGDTSAINAASAFNNKWQDLLIRDNNGLPKTPLFALLSLPAFMIFGPNEDLAIIINLLVLSINSVLLVLLTRKLLPEIALGWLHALIILLYNLIPGVYGFARLYMSETLQTTFVLLIALLCYKYQRSVTLRNFFVLGVTLGLGWLLRFLTPVYVVVPLFFFFFQQFRMRKNWTYYLKSMAVFFLGFVIISLTWYGRNLFPYLEFARSTSSGPLAEYFSFGPVFSPITIAKYWYVLVLWLLGWPFGLLAFFTICLRFIQVPNFWKNFSGRYLGDIGNPYLWLILTPLPTLLALTFSVSKSARYFLPVVPFWIILVALLVVKILLSETRWLNTFRASAVVLVLILAYPFLQSLSPGLPILPGTGQNYASTTYVTSDSSAEGYEFFYEIYRTILATNKSGSDGLAKDSGASLIYNNLKIYNTADQSNFHEAGLIWYGTQHGYKINSIGEFARYDSVDSAKVKIDQADILIVHSDPSGDMKERQKFVLVRDYALGHKDFVVVAERPVGNGRISILYKVQ